MAKKKSGLNISTPILYILLGALLAIFPSEMLEWAMTLAGIFFIISGIVDILKNNTLGGAVNLVIGIVVLVLGWTITNIVLFVLGILIAVKGLTDLIGVLKRKKKSVIGIIFAVITMIVGLALAFGNGLNYVIIAVGVILIIDGVIGLFGKK